MCRQWLYWSNCGCLVHQRMWMVLVGLVGLLGLVALLHTVVTNERVDKERIPLPPGLELELFVLYKSQFHYHMPFHGRSTSIVRIIWAVCFRL